MRQLLTPLICGLILFASCKKDNIVSNADTLKLIQNNWTSISSRLYTPNSSTITIQVKDSFQVFRSDSYLIDCIGKNVIDPNLPPLAILLSDTSSYTLLQDNSTLLFYPIYNGIQRTNADTVNIRTITDKLFVYYWNQGQGFGILDSLKR